MYQCVLCHDALVQHSSRGYALMRRVLADDDCKGIEECTLMLSLSVFMVSCSTEVIHVNKLLEQCIDIFTDAWESKSPRV